MKILNTNIDDVKIIIPDVYGDNRGYFYESFNEDEFSTKVQPIKFVQDNQSKSSKGVLRGLHFQNPPHAQAKLVRCTHGSVFDVAVDLRKGSPTYGKYVYDILSAENHHQLFIPKGFAHGFVALEENTIFQYKCDNYYNKDSEDGIAYDDGTLCINWPISQVSCFKLSEKDIDRKLFKDFDSPFIYNK